MHFTLNKNYSLVEHHKMITCKDLREEDLDELFEEVCTYMKEKGFNIREGNNIELGKNKKKYPYQNVISFNAEHGVNNMGVLLCAANGKDVFYDNYVKHKDCTKSIVLFSVLHIMGHLWQWCCANDTEVLRYTGKKAWELGSKIYEDRREGIDISEIIGYETEAIALSIKNLQVIYTHCDLSESFKNKFLEYYRYYSLIDLNALVKYYNTSSHINIFKLNNPDIRCLDLDYDITENNLQTIRLNIQRVRN